MEFTVKRSEWYRGHGSHGSRLSRFDGQKCCLGFFAKACGYSNEEICNRSWLRSLSWNRGEKIPGKILADEHIFTRINDQPGYDDQFRELELTRLFNKHNIQVNFVD